MGFSRERRAIGMKEFDHKIKKTLKELRRSVSTPTGVTDAEQRLKEVKNQLKIIVFHFVQNFKNCITNLCSC